MREVQFKQYSASGGVVKGSEVNHVWISCSTPRSYLFEGAREREIQKTCVIKIIYFEGLWVFFLAPSMIRT